jgi:hypothetical protein
MHDGDDDGTALAQLHRLVQLVDQVKKLLMFGIAAFDADAIGRIPGN